MDFMKSNRVYHLQSNLHLMAGEEIVHELISFLAEYQVGKQPDGTTDVPDDTSFLLVILGAGNIDEDILSNEVMDELIDNMAKLA
jgi:hypothetical protein